MSDDNPKVVSIHGGQPVRQNFGETDPAMVEFLEELLARAKVGKLMGLVGCYMQENGEPHKHKVTFVFADGEHGEAMLGLVTLAQMRLAKKIWPDDPADAEK